MGKHSFRLAEYPGVNLDNAVRAAGIWSRGWLNNHPGYFTAKERNDAFAMRDEALGLQAEATKIEEDHDASGYTYTVYPDARPGMASKAKCAFGAWERDTVPWPLWSYSYPNFHYDMGIYNIPAANVWQMGTGLSFGQMVPSPKKRAKHARQCFYVTTPDLSTMVAEPGRASVWMRSGSREGFVVRNGIEDLNSSISQYREGLKDDIRQKGLQAASIMRCVQAGVAFKVSYAQNKAEYEKTVRPVRRATARTFRR